MVDQAEQKAIMFDTKQELKAAWKRMSSGMETWRHEFDRCDVGMLGWLCICIIAKRRRLVVW